MRIARIFLCFFFLGSFAFPCVCSMQITESFNNYTTHIADKLTTQKDSIKTLTKSVDKNTESLKSQNTLLNQELALLQKESLQSKELLFLLKQANRLK
ncbi:hypothetical protein NCR96_08860 [Helicobacter sp. 14348-15]|uniref:hypothetical protein n=1 Tax=Helicobacter TaxID=209 RepID=UPI001F5A158E|nr:MULTISPECIES: hypothetical protein [Helicobacter]MCI2236802.1 hypothetical protein [Helicobacter sp. CaF467b]MCL9821842.1 hypothetical protein [Helicobacter colisuis]